MLVLTRNFDATCRDPESRVRFILPDGRVIRLYVLSQRTCGDLRLGIEAPADVVVKREELLSDANAEGSGNAR